MGDGERAVIGDGQAGIGREMFVIDVGQGRPILEGGGAGGVIVHGNADS